MTAPTAPMDTDEKAELAAWVEDWAANNAPGPGSSNLPLLGQPVARTDTAGLDLL